MQLIVGTLDHTTSRKAGREGEQWDEVTMVLLDYGVTHYVKMGRDFGAVPESGELIVAAVAIRAYPKRSGSYMHGDAEVVPVRDQRAGFELIATRRLDTAETALAPLFTHVASPLAG